MSRLLLSFAFLISLTAGFDPATAQTPTAGTARSGPPTREPKNAGHCDRAVKAQTLPLALEYIWQGYVPKK